LRLGLLYRDGRGIGKDPTRAIFWLSQAARHGDPEAQLRFSQLLSAGAAGPADPAEAYRWASLAERSAEDQMLRQDATALRQQLAPRLTRQQITTLDAAVESWRPAETAAVSE
jgi:TPR repeat protein